MNPRIIQQKEMVTVKSLSNQGAAWALVVSSRSTDSQDRPRSY